MISIDAVERSIVELESGDTSFATCEKLAWLYIVRDHLRGYSVESQKPLELDGRSELLQAANGKNPEAVWSIINDHMEVVKVVYPKEYAAVVDKINSLDNTHESKDQVRMTNI